MVRGSIRMQKKTHFRIMTLPVTYEMLNLSPGIQTSHRFFGEILILQTPEDMNDPLPAKEGWYSYLMQFMDGNRIDLSFHPLDKLHRVKDDSLSLVLIDKDNRIGILPPPSDASYLVKIPTRKAFDDCCNEFWWLNTYVAKGLWRDELTYARYMLDGYMRDELMKMLAWYFGISTDFKRSPGKFGKYLRSGLDESTWKMLQKTYSDEDPEHTWAALLAMDDLFRMVALKVADKFGFAYPKQDDDRVVEFIHRIKDRPRDAKEI